jgi:acetyl-CoA acetyltransferase
MTKFGKHPDQDTVDLAADASMAALADAGVTMKDIGILAAGNLMALGGGIGQPLQYQIGETGIPVYNVANACTTGATALRTAIMAVQAGEVKYGLAVGVEKLAGAGLIGGAVPATTRTSSSQRAATAPSRLSTAASAPTTCPACSTAAAAPSQLAEHIGRVFGGLAA